MSCQAAVTTYFTRKRKREAVHASKRVKLDNGDKVNNINDEKNSSKTSVVKTSDCERIKVKLALKKSNLKQKTLDIQEYFKPCSNLTKDVSQLSSKKTKQKISLPSNISVDFENLQNQESSLTRVKFGSSSQLSPSSHKSEMFEPLNSAIDFTKAVSKTPLHNISTPNSKTSKVGMPVGTSGSIAFPKVSMESLPFKGCKPQSAQQVLENKNKLQDLQETLIKIKQLKEKSKILKKQNEISLKAVNIDKKHSYAYSNYHYLAQKISEDLRLPYKYKVLFELFQSLDTVVSMLFNRKEIISWSKVEHSVREITRKSFEFSHLSQIKYLYPEAYEYRQERNIISFSDLHKRSKFELTISPIFEIDKTTANVDKMTGGILIQRKHQFHLRLLDVTKEHHKKFLSSLQPPVEVGDDVLRRWHPRFSLDTVPDIGMSPLPSPPDKDLLHCHSAKEIFEKTKSTFTKKAADALKIASLLKTKHLESANNKNCNYSALPAKTIAFTSVEGISKSLLEKIRAKEAVKNLKLMQRSEEKQKRLNHLKNLPDVCHALRSLFVNEKKTSLPLYFLCLKLSQSCPLVSTPVAVEQHLHLLSTTLESWFQVIQLRGVEYGRLVNQDMQMSDVSRELASRLKAENND